MIGITHTEILSGSATIVKVEGPLNSQTSFDFEDYINQLIDKKIYFILFDAKDLDYISSEGIGVLLLVQQKMSELNGYLVFFNLSEDLVSFFTILGFDNVFKIAGSRIQAIQIMDRQIELREMGDDFSDRQQIAIQLDTEQLETAESFAEEDKQTAGATEQDNRIVEAYIADSQGTKNTIKVKPQVTTEADISGKTDQTEDGEKSVDTNEQVPVDDDLQMSDDDLITLEVEQSPEEAPKTEVDKDSITEHPAENTEETKEEHEPQKEHHLHYKIDTNNHSFQQPLIVECKKCKSLVRVKEPGEYLCPDCRIVFTARKDQTVVFDLSE